MRNIARNTGRGAAAAATARCRSGRFLSSASSLDQPPDTSRLEYRAVPKDDLGELEEYSVIFTNRALNTMSRPFQQVMRDLNELLKTTYNAHKVAIIPG